MFEIINEHKQDHSFKDLKIGTFFLMNKQGTSFHLKTDNGEMFVFDRSTLKFIEFSELNDDTPVIPIQIESLAVSKIGA